MRYQSWYITGASSGIGESFARLAPRSARLLLGGRNLDRLTGLAGELGAERSYCLPGDLTLAADREAAILAAEEAKIDLLILNAGIGQFGAFLDNPPKREMEMMLLNMVAPVEAARALLPGMIARAETTGRRAGLIFTASVAGIKPLPYLGTYAATKAFLLHVGEALAVELKEKPVDCLVLCPGSTRTRFFDRAGAKAPLGPLIASADQVAKEGLNMLGKKRVHIAGVGNRLFAALLPFLPNALFLPAAGSVVRQR